jgi:type I restriction enzyme, S subunit
MSSSQKLLKNYIFEEKIRNKKDENIPVWSITNDKGIILSTDYFKKKVHSKKLTNYKIIESNQIGYNPSRINVGSVALNQTSEKGLLSPLYVIFSCNSDLIPKYLTYFLKSPIGLNQIHQNTEGTVRDSLKFSGLSRIKTKIPSIDEQRKIIKILENLDSLIQNHKKSLELHENFLEDVMSIIFSLDSETKKSNFVQFLDVNEEWSLENFSEYVFFQEGPGIRNWQFTDKGMKVINVANLVFGELDLSKSKRHVSKEEFNKKYTHFAINEGDIVLSSSGYSYGKVAVVKESDLPIMLNTSVIRLRTLDKERLEQEFLKSFLQSSVFKNQINKLITGIDIPNFGSSHLKKIKMNIPKSINEQKKISSMLRNINKIINNERKYSNRAEQLKKEITKKIFSD